jgi:hypothetical protein
MKAASESLLNAFIHTLIEYGLLTRELVGIRVVTPCASDVWRAPVEGGRDASTTYWQRT